ncbi:NHLP bacteriocin system secretion protein [Pantanalinema rosaneae CENA516]|uniref:NHLP bacteriocin system secretion protein n=1 Tax=Pantanalinema rosaneae TaxID=1620701 RepID=UPI003D6E3986
MNMVTQKRDLFRQESLERLSSPERLDQLMQVVNPKSWLPLASLGIVVGSALIWSIYGRIPVTIEGQGVLVFPSQVVSLQSKSSGQLISLNVKVGDQVKKGQVLGTIDQSELHKQLQQQRRKLTVLQSQDQAVGSLQGLRNEQERHFIQQQRQYLRRRIQELQELSPLLESTSGQSIQEQRQSLQQRLKQAQLMSPIYQERLQIRQQLFAERIITHDVLLEAQIQVQQNRDTIAETQAQLKQLTAKATEQEKSNRDNFTSIGDVQAQLKELDSREANLAQQNLEASTNRQKEMQETQREIAQLELKLRNNSAIVSQHSGRILEIAVNPGQVIEAGTRLGSIETELRSSNLMGMSYFTIADGKKIQPGMTIQVTPQTVKREQFGGIVGTVTAISEFPVTTEAAASVVGNPEVVKGLVADKQDGVIQVVADLKPDAHTQSGYAWSSSQGPSLKLSSGTTTTVRVTVEERAPITFVLPILRSYSGIY